MSTAQNLLGWYLVYTKPRQEEVARINLEQQGYTCYLPLIEIEKIRRRKAVLVTEPMFARYLFIQLDRSTTGKSWSPIRSTLGVSTLVHFGGQPTKVDDRLIDGLRQREQHLEAQALFTSGDKVVVTEGAFAGLEAIFQANDAEQRAIILLEILSKPVLMRVAPASLLKA